MTCITGFLKGENVSTALVPAIRAAADSDKLLYFPPGDYHFYPEGCSGKYCYFSNNDEGVKTIAILLEGLDDFTLRGENAKFIFHGRISPLCAFGCRNLTVEGVTVDFEDSFVSDADLIYRKDGIAWFRFPGKHRVENGKIVFTGDFYDNLSGELFCYCYDREKNELTNDSTCRVIPNSGILSCDGLVGIKDCFEGAGTDAFVIKHELRLCPGMVFDGCTDIQIRNVRIHHAAGMGFLIQNSENCCIDQAEISPCGRRASVSDDALHITDSRGKFKIMNCNFSGTLDDSINVHGVFRKLKSRIPGGKIYYLEAGHYQQQGVFNIRPGDTMQLYSRKDAKPYGKVKINGIIPVNKGFWVVRFDEKDLPEDFVQGDPVQILETSGELEVINTRCSTLNGRGVLASGLERVLISDCYFHTSEAGVFISGDFSFWYESGPVKEALIENNVFDNCNYRVFTATQEPLAVFPELPSLADGYFYHGTIRVKGNRFLSAERPLISILSAAEAEVTGNVFELDDRYPFISHPTAGYNFTTKDSPMASFLHCGVIRDTQNTGFRK